MSQGLAPYAAYVVDGDNARSSRPRHWLQTRIKFIAALNPSKSETAHLPPDTLVSFLPMEAVSENGELDLSRTRPLGELRNGYTYLRDGDVCIAKITPCFENGKGAVIQGALGGIAFGTTELIPIRCHEPADAQFLYYVLKTPPFKVDAEASMYGAGGQKRVADSFVGNYEIPLPLPSERIQIARFLDYETAKIDRLIDKQQQLIALLKEKRQAVISHAVTKGLNPNAPMKDSGVEWLGQVPAHWTVGKCGFCLRVISGYAFPSTGFTDDQADVRLLRGINVGVGTVRWNETVRWRRHSTDGLDPWQLSEGDLVIGMDRPMISEGVRLAKIGADDVPSLLLQRVALLRPRPRLNRDFLSLLLSLPKIFEAHFAPETTGVSVPHISPKQVSDFVIAIPPRAEQDKIVVLIQEQLAKLDELVVAAEAAADLLQERRTALISAAVTGKIDVRSWTPPDSDEEAQQAA